MGDEEVDIKIKMMQLSRFLQLNKKPNLGYFIWRQREHEEGTTGI